MSLIPLNYLQRVFKESLSQASTTLKFSSNSKLNNQDLNLADCGASTLATHPQVDAKRRIDITNVYSYLSREENLSCSDFCPNVLKVV